MAADELNLSKFWLLANPLTPKLVQIFAAGLRPASQHFVLSLRALRAPKLSESEKHPRPLLSGVLGRYYHCHRLTLHIVSHNALLQHKTFLFLLSYFCPIFQYCIMFHPNFLGHKQRGTRGTEFSMWGVMEPNVGWTHSEKCFNTYSSPEKKRYIGL